VTHVGCLAHVRRKFFEAEKQGSSEASIFLSQIAELYHTEHTLRQPYDEGAFSTEAFLISRREAQQPKLSAMKGWLLAKQGTSPPSLAFGKAVHYALGQWESIEKYCEHALLTPDNNVKVGLHFPVLVGFNFPVSIHHSKPTAPTRSRSFMR